MDGWGRLIGMCVRERERVDTADDSQVFYCVLCVFDCVFIWPKGGGEKDSSSLSL